MADMQLREAVIVNLKVDAGVISERNAKQFALDSEAWAVGKRNGSDVSSTDETYHNNAKYYATNANLSADDASTAMASALIYKNQAESAKNTAVDAKVDAINAMERAETAQDKAEQAAAQSGYMFFYIDDDGHLIYQRTENTQVDFYLENGHLFVTPTEE